MKCVVGAQGSGKSALVYRFIENKFRYEDHPTLEDRWDKEVVTEDKVPCKIIVLDTGGAEETFNSLSNTVTLVFFFGFFFCLFVGLLNSGLKRVKDLLLFTILPQNLRLENCGISFVKLIKLNRMHHVLSLALNVSTKALFFFGVVNTVDFAS